MKCRLSHVRPRLVVVIWITMLSIANAQQAEPPQERQGYSAPGPVLESPAEDHSLEQSQIRSAMKAISSASTPEQRAVAEKDLRSALEKYFDLDIGRRRMQLDAVRRTIADLEKVIKEREANRKGILDLRVEVIEAEAQGLGWPGDAKDTVRTNAGKNDGTNLETEDATARDSKVEMGSKSSQSSGIDREQLTNDEVKEAEDKALLEFADWIDNVRRQEIPLHTAITQYVKSAQRVTTHRSKLLDNCEIINRAITPQFNDEYAFGLPRLLETYFGELAIGYQQHTTVLLPLEETIAKVAKRKTPIPTSTLMRRLAQLVLEYEELLRSSPELSNSRRAMPKQIEVVCRCLEGEMYQLVQEVTGNAPQLDSFMRPQLPHEMERQGQTFRELLRLEAIGKESTESVEVVTTITGAVTSWGTGVKEDALIKKGSLIATVGPIDAERDRERAGRRLEDARSGYEASKSAAQPRRRLLNRSLCSYRRTRS